jgi:hypothetical protein
MPDPIFDASKGRAELLMDGQWWAAPESGVGQWKLVEPVRYLPFIIYRSRVLWHNHSDAMEVAWTAARSRSMRHEVKPVRVPGWDHLLWQIRPATYGVPQ